MTTSTALPVEVEAVVEATIADGSTDGLIVSIGRGAEAPVTEAFGVDGRGVPLQPDSLAPVASISKMATSLAVLRLVADGKLGLDDLLSQYAPDAVAARHGVSLRALLAHTAGLPDDIPPDLGKYGLGLTWHILAQGCLATPPAHQPWKRVCYSNVGQGLLAVVVERVVGQPFNVALRQLVLDPLGLEAYLGDEPPRACASIGGDLGTNAGTEIESFNTPFWRSLAMPWGGLITTMPGALALVRAFAGVPAGFLPADLLAEATRDQTRGLPGNMLALGSWPHNAWGLGVELRGTKRRHWAATASPNSFGHLGAAGCIAWFDPEADVAWSIHGLKVLGGLFSSMPNIAAAILKSTRSPHYA